MKLFYSQKDASRFSADVEFIVDSKNIELIHAFVKSSHDVGKVVGDEEKFRSSSEQFLSVIRETQAKGEIVFFLELGV